MNLQTLVVERVVVHRIPKKEPKARAGEQEPLSLSQAVTPLDADGDQLRAYMIQRLKSSLQSADKAFDVVFDGDSPSPIPGQVRDFLSVERTGVGTLNVRDQALVDLSRAMAEQLFAVQPSQPPTGLLAVCSGTLDDQPLVAIMKLEHERGVTVDDDVVDGLRRFKMTVADDLVLTGGTKVFKAAAFAVLPGQDAGIAPDDLACDARVSDSQTPFHASTQAAYYTDAFLGVRLSDAPRVVTEQVYKATETFINEQIEDPAEQVGAARALLVEMDSHKQTFSAQTFANSHLSQPLRSQLRDHLKAEGLPTQGFPKDTELIERRLRMLSMRLGGDITVVAPEDRFEDQTISVDTSVGDQNAVVTIHAPLLSTHSRGR